MQEMEEAAAKKAALLAPPAEGRPKSGRRRPGSGRYISIFRNSCIEPSYLAPTHTRRGQAKSERKRDLRVKRGHTNTDKSTEVVAVMTAKPETWCLQAGVWNTRGGGEALPHTAPSVPHREASRRGRRASVRTDQSGRAAARHYRRARGRAGAARTAQTSQRPRARRQRCSRRFPVATSPRGPPTYYQYSLSRHVT